MSSSSVKPKPDGKYLPLVMGYLTPELVDKARVELNETKYTRTKALAEFRKRVTAEEDLVCRDDDEYFLQFLRARKFDVDRAFDLFQHYFKFIGDYKDVFREFDEARNTSFFSTGIGGFLPERDSDGCVIFFWRIEKWDPDDFDIVTVVRAISQLFVYMVEDEATQVCGVQAIVDLKGATLKQMTSFSPHYLQFLGRAVRNVVPVRFKHIHFINESIIFQLMWKVIKLFLSDKIKERIHFHGDKIKNLHDDIPTEILPEMYGGKLTNFNFVENLKQTLPTQYKMYKKLIRTGYKETK